MFDVFNGFYCNSSRGICLRYICGFHSVGIMVATLIYCASRKSKQLNVDPTAIIYDVAAITTRNTVKTDIIPLNENTAYGLR